MLRTILMILVLRIFINPVKAFHNGIEIKIHEAKNNNFLFYILKKEGDTKDNQKWKYKCTATAISKNTLITAAHCFKDYWNNSNKEWRDIFYIHPAQHNLNLNNSDEVCLQCVPINITNDVKIHDKFKEENIPKCPAYDVVKIMISNMQLIQRTVPLCYGLHTEGKAISLIKAEVNHIDPLIMNYGVFQVEKDPNKCTDANGNIYLRNNDTQICTTSLNSHHSEDGDSGAPLLLTSTTKPSSTCLMGVLSCGSKRYTIFSKPTKNDIWKEYFPVESHNATTSNNNTHTNGSTNTVLDTALYCHIIIIISVMLPIIFILCWLHNQIEIND